MAVPAEPFHAHPCPLSSTLLDLTQPEPSAAPPMRWGQHGSSKVPCSLEVLGLLVFSQVDTVPDPALPPSLQSGSCLHNSVLVC